MTARRIRISNDLGLHLRAAGVLARVASEFKCDVTLQRGSQSANAKSIMSVLALAATTGTELQLITDGHDAEHAAERIASLVESGFREP